MYRTQWTLEPTPILHSKSRPLLAQARTQTPRLIFTLVADAERPLPDVARKPQGGAPWGNQMAVTEAVPCVCFPAFCPSNAITFLLWCNIVVQESNVIKCFVFLLSPCSPSRPTPQVKLSKQAWKGFTAGFHMVEIQCY